MALPKHLTVWLRGWLAKNLEDLNPHRIGSFSEHGAGERTDRESSPGKFAGSACTGRIAAKQDQLRGMEALHALAEIRVDLGHLHTHVRVTEVIQRLERAK